MTSDTVIVSALTRENCFWDDLCSTSCTSHPLLGRYCTSPEHQGAAGTGAEQMSYIVSALSLGGHAHFAPLSTDRKRVRRNGQTEAGEMSGMFASLNSAMRELREGQKNQRGPNHFETIGILCGAISISGVWCRYPNDPTNKGFRQPYCILQECATDFQTNCTTLAFTLLCLIKSHRCYALKSQRYGMYVHNPKQNSISTQKKIDDYFVFSEV